MNGTAIGLGVAGGVFLLIMIGVLGYKYRQTLSAPAPVEPV